MVKSSGWKWWLAFGLLCSAGISTTALAAQALKITVYGGSGRIGQAIVVEALSRGHQVTVVARDPSGLALKNPNLNVVTGDVMDTAAVTRQLAGQDVVISAIGRGHGQEAGDELLVKTAKSLVAAQRSLGAKAPRLLVVGSASIFGNSESAPSAAATAPQSPGPPQQPPPGGSGPGYSPAGAPAQRLALEYLRSVTDVPWTYVSPAQRIDPGTRTGKYRISTDQLLRDAAGESRISREDYGVAMIDEAERPAHVRGSFTVAY